MSTHDNWLNIDESPQWFVIAIKYAAVWIVAVLFAVAGALFAFAAPICWPMAAVAAMFVPAFVLELRAAWQNHRLIIEEREAHFRPRPPAPTQVETRPRHWEHEENPPTAEFLDWCWKYAQEHERRVPGEKRCAQKFRNMPTDRWLDAMAHAGVTTERREREATLWRQDVDLRTAYIKFSYMPTPARCGLLPPQAQKLPPVLGNQAGEGRG